MSGWDGGRGEREGPAPLVEPGGHKPLAPVRVSMPASWAGLPPAFGPQPAVRPPSGLSPRPSAQGLALPPGSGQVAAGRLSVRGLTLCIWCLQILQERGSRM